MTRYYMISFDFICRHVTSRHIASRHVLYLPLGEVDASRAMRTDPNDSELEFELPLECAFELEFELEFGLSILIVDR